MASFSRKITILTFVFSFLNSWMATSADPEITSDFLIPENVKAASINATFFTYSGLRGVFNTNVTKFTATKATKVEFPALAGQGISISILQYPNGVVNPPHIHPRGAELIFVLKGSIEVGFVDTTNKLFTQKLQQSDLFVFPKGLVHFHYNSDPNYPALAISAFGSANAGTLSLPGALFSSGIEDEILAKSFKTDSDTIKKIQAALAPPVAAAAPAVPAAAAPPKHH